MKNVHCHRLTLGEAWEVIGFYCDCHKMELVKDDFVT